MTAMAPSRTWPKGRKGRGEEHEQNFAGGLRGRSAVDHARQDFKPPTSSKGPSVDYCRVVGTSNLVLNDNIVDLKDQVVKLMDEVGRRRQQLGMDLFVPARLRLGIGSQGRLRHGLWLPEDELQATKTRSTNASVFTTAWSST